MIDDLLMTLKILILKMFVFNLFSNSVQAMFLINSINHTIYIALDRIIPKGSITVVDKNQHTMATRQFENSNFEKLSLKNISGYVTVTVQYDKNTDSRSIYVH